jgi:hypothetical protein
VLRNSILAWTSIASSPSKASMTSVYSAGADKSGASWAAAAVAIEHDAATHSEAAASDKRGPRCSANAMGRGRDNTCPSIEGEPECEPIDRA